MQNKDPGNFQTMDWQCTRNPNALISIAKVRQIQKKTKCGNNLNTDIRIGPRIAAVKANPKNMCPVVRCGQYEDGIHLSSTQQNYMKIWQAAAKLFWHYSYALCRTEVLPDILRPMQQLMCMGDIAEHRSVESFNKATGRGQDAPRCYTA